MFWCTEGEIYRAMGGCVATHLINLLVDPIPANQRLDVAPDQEGGENQEDEEPGEQESQAHAAGRGRGGGRWWLGSPEQAGRDLPGQLQPRGSVPSPGTPGWAGRWQRGVPGSGAGLPGRSSFSQSCRRGRRLQKFFRWDLSQPLPWLCLDFFGGSVRWSSPPAPREAYTRRNLAPASPRHS